MSDKSRSDKSRVIGIRSEAPEIGIDPFQSGALVIVTLSNPRDKFWGMILALNPEGLSLTGAELASLDDLISMVKEGELYTPAVLFFPMHRIERIELDLPDGGLPSVSQRFSARTGQSPEEILGSLLEAARLKKKKEEE